MALAKVPQTFQARWSRTRESRCSNAAASIPLAAENRRTTERAVSSVIQSSVVLSQSRDPRS
jgi:hypothetical protein